MADAKKNILTYAGLQELEAELEDLKVNKRKEVAQKIKEAREQGDLSENAEYDAAKDEQRDMIQRLTLDVISSFMISNMMKTLSSAWLVQHRQTA